MKRILFAFLAMAAVFPVTGWAADDSTAGTTAAQRGWNFRLAPDSGPVLGETPEAVKAPLFSIRMNSKVRRKGQGEPLIADAPRLWWTGDFMTPLEKSRFVIPRSDRVRD